MVMLRDPSVTGRNAFASWDLIGLLKDNFLQGQSYAIYPNNTM